MRLLGGLGHKEASRNDVIDPRAFQLENTAIFQQLPSLFFKIAVFFEFKTWEKDQIIQKQGENITTFYWIIRGAVKVSKIVPFISKSNNGKVTLKSYNGQEFQSVKKQYEEEKLVQIELETQGSLQQGDWMPYIPIDANLITSPNWSEESYFLCRTSSPSECQLTAEDNVLTASISFLDLIAVTTTPGLQLFFENTPVYRFPMEVLQEQYLDQRKWESHKKGIVEEVINRKGIERERARNRLQDLKTRDSL